MSDDLRPYIDMLDPADPPSPLDEILRAWVGCVQRLIETAPIDSVVDETGITKRNHSTPPERRAIRDEALAVVDRWFIRDLLRLDAYRAALASSPAPAGLDVERLAEALMWLDDIRNITPQHGQFYRHWAEQVLARAATRPAEDAEG